MFASAGLGAVRPFMAALILPQSDFGYYTSIIGLVGFASMLVSFGTVEATTKLYPRLWEGGHRLAIWQDAFATFRTIGLWLLLPLLLGLSLSYFGLIAIGTFPILLLCLFTWLSVLLNLLASMIRATHSLALLQTFSFLRSAIPLAAVGLALFWADWFIAIAAETLAATLTGLAAAFLVHRRLKSASAETQKHREDRNNADGRILYFANLLSSSISLVDRAIVTAILGAVQGGAYGMAALVVQAGSLLIGIISQKVGPEVIRHVYQGASLQSALDYARFPLGALVLAACLMLAAYFAGIMFLPELGASLLDCGIGPLAVVLAAILIILQIYMLFQFFLLAMDDETSVFYSGAAGVAIFASGVFLAWYFAWPMEAFLASMVAARLVQIIVAAECLRQKIMARPKDFFP